MERKNAELHHWGLPHTRFDQALAWGGGFNRRNEGRRIVSTDGFIHRIPYPSWSWLEWTGIDFTPFNWRLHERTMRGESQSELDSYKLGFDGTVERIKDIEDMVDTDDIDGIEGLSHNAEYPERKTVKDCYVTLSTVWKGDTEVTGPITIQTKRSNTLSDKILNEPSPWPKEDSDNVTTTVIDQYFLDTGRLVFYTSQARAIARRPGGYEDEILKTIGDNHVWLESILPSEYMSDWQSGEERILDCIVISRCCDLWDGHETDMLNLMVIKWSDTEVNVASRTGLAKIAEADWVRLDREWKMVILE